MIDIARALWIVVYCEARQYEALISVGPVAKIGPCEKRLDAAHAAYRKHTGRRWTPAGEYPSEAECVAAREMQAAGTI